MVSIAFSRGPIPRLPLHPPVADQDDIALPLAAPEAAGMSSKTSPLTRREPADGSLDPMHDEG